MWYTRIFENRPNFFTKGKVNMVYGPRRVGKTTLLNKLISTNIGHNYLGNGDDVQLRNLLSSEDKTLILSAFSSYDLVFIDEAQRINNIGWALKILVDNMPNATIIATGSSSFHLSNYTGEPLTGRNISNILFPISIFELNQQIGGMKVIENLNNYLVYGMYPEVLTSESTIEKAKYLNELRNSYLLKDILELENIRNSDKIFDLLQIIAFQIGNEVSLTELGNAIGMSKITVERYLDLLENSFVIKKVRGFSRNLRKEVVKTSRYYFYDNGIRNSIINNFNPLAQRNDIGMLWENFMFIERIKSQSYKENINNYYFWRTYDQKEVDMVEERDSKLYGFEYKWNSDKMKIQTEWLKTYPNSSFEIIHKDNFLSHLI